jgi:hypothetical protein
VATRTAARKPVKKDDKAVVIETKMMKVSDLHPFYRNPRIGDVGLIAESLEQNGQFRPIVVNIGSATGRKFEILAGNHTWLGARHLGWKEVLVSLVDVDDERAKKIVLADNKTADAGGYDPELLAELVSGIPDITGTGYSDDEVAALLANLPTADEATVNTPITDLLNGLSVGPGEAPPKDKRTAIIEERDDEEQEAARNRGAETPKFDDDTDIEDMEPDAAVQRRMAELQAVLELREGEEWFGNNEWQIPDLRTDMLVEQVDPNLRCWAGADITPDDGRQFLYNYSLGGIRGLPFDRAILAFNCVDVTTEALTQRGWLRYDQITDEDVILSMVPETGELRWSKVLSVFRKHYTGKMHHLVGPALDALVTPGHKFALVTGELKPVEGLRGTDVIRTMGLAEQNTANVYSDGFVELVGWAVTEGSYRIGVRRHSVVITQKTGTPTERRIRQVIKEVQGSACPEYKSGSNCTAFSITGALAHELIDVAPDRVPTMQFILSLSARQRVLLVDTMIAADGWHTGLNGRCYTQKDRRQTDMFELLCALIGVSTTTRYREWATAPNGEPIVSKQWNTVLKLRQVATVRKVLVGRGDARTHTPHRPTVDYDDIVWCPTTEYGTWVCRRNGKVYVTGNTHDDKFINWWNIPSYYVAKFLVRGLTMAVAPDNSFYYTMPRVLHLKGVYQSQWLARFMQEAGIRIIPRIQYADEKSFKFNLLGIPKEPPVVETSIQNFNPKDGDKSKAAREKHFRLKLKMLQACIDKLHPQNQIIVYGETVLRYLEDQKPGNAQVIGVKNYVGERREIAFGKKEGAASVKGTDRQKLLKAARKKLEEEGRPVADNREPDWDDEGLDELETEVAEAEKAAEPKTSAKTRVRSPRRKSA